MLKQPIMDKMAAMKLTGMLEGLHKNRWKVHNTINFPSFIIPITQVPISECHERFGNPTLSDTTMDRVIHNAYRLELKGESMRKHKSPLTHSGHNVKE